PRAAATSAAATIWPPGEAPGGCGRGARAPSVLAGFYDMTGAQLALTDALHRAGLFHAIFVPAGAGEAYRFAQPFVRHFADALPLFAQRIGRGVASLLRLRERGFPRAEVLELVRDGFRARTRIHADRADAATRAARIAGGPSDDLRRIRKRSFEVDDYIAL